MANAFTATRAWTYGGTSHKAIMKVEGVLVIDTTGGDTAGDLPVALFGLKEIIGVATFTKSDDAKGYLGVPSYDAGSILLAGIASAGALVDLPNGTYKVSIQGYY